MSSDGKNVWGNTLKDTAGTFQECNISLLMQGKNTILLTMKEALFFLQYLMNTLSYKQLMRMKKIMNYTCSEY